MKTLIVCRILSEINPVQYKYIRTCICPIFKCSQNNLKLQEEHDSEMIPYIKCKLDKQKEPRKYLLSNNCICENKCKNKKI